MNGTATDIRKVHVSIPRIMLGIMLFMLGSGLMVSIIGFPIGIVLFAAGLGLMDDATDVRSGNA